MDNKDKKVENLIKALENVQKEFPNLVLPNMGIIDNEKKVEIYGKDYLKKKGNGEDQL